MQKYAGGDKGSGISHFEIADSAITVWFKNSGRSYTYSYDKAGWHHVETMKQLALAGDGLNVYLNENVRMSYD